MPIAVRVDGQHRLIWVELVRSRIGHVEMAIPQPHGDLSVPVLLAVARRAVHHVWASIHGCRWGLRPIPHVRRDVGAATAACEAMWLRSVLGVFQGQPSHVELIRHGEVEVMIEMRKSRRRQIYGD